MTATEQYNMVLELSKDNVRRFLKMATTTCSWLLTDENDDAIGEISIIAIAMILQGMPISLAVAHAVKAYSEKLEES